MIIYTFGEVNKMEGMIVVLDFGSQYNQLITRRIREFGVYSELHPHTITAEEIKALNPKGIIFSGGPNSVYGENAFHCDENIFELGIPDFRYLLWNAINDSSFWRESRRC